MAVKFGGFDENGNVIHVACVEHKYSDLPMKGLGKSFENVGLNEPVIILLSDQIDPVSMEIWKNTDFEIKRRAFELNAKVLTYELPSYLGGPKFQLIFVPLENTHGTYR